MSAKLIMLRKNNNNARDIHIKSPLKVKSHWNLTHNYFDKFPQRNKLLLVIGRAKINDKVAFITVFQHFPLCSMFKQEQCQRKKKKSRDMLMIQIGWFRLL